MWTQVKIEPRLYVRKQTLLRAISEKKISLNFGKMIIKPKNSVFEIYEDFVQLKEQFILELTFFFRFWSKTIPKLH